MNKIMIDIDKLLKEPQRGNIRYFPLGMLNVEYAKIIAAMANTGGGSIILGIEDDGVDLHVKGFPFESPNQNEIVNLLNGFTKFSISRTSYDQNKLIVIEIDKAINGLKYHGDYLKFQNDYDNSVMAIKQVNVFISYNQKISELGDILQDKLEEEYSFKVKVNRDTELNYKDNIKEFMKSIKQNDVIISLVSGSYLKSEACMYEMYELTKDDNYKSKLIFIILNKSDKSLFTKKIPSLDDLVADVYSANRFDYMQFWKNESEEYKERWENLKDNSDAAGGLQREITTVGRIISSTDKFIEMLNQSLGTNFSQMKKDNFKELKSLIDAQYDKKNLG